MKTAILLFFLFAAVAFGAANEPPMDSPDDFSPMLFGFLVAGLCIMLFLVGVGIVAGAIVAVSAGILVALGIVSSSALIGLFRRRFSSSFRAFHYQVFAVAAVPAGVGALALGAHFFGSHLQLRDIFVIGSIAGICGGLLLAFAFDRLAVIAYRRFAMSALSKTTEMPEALPGS